MDAPRKPSTKAFALAKEWDERHTSPDWLGPREPRSECARCGNPLMVTIDRKFCSFVCAGEPEQRAEALWRAKDEVEEWQNKVNCEHCRTSKGEPKRLHFTKAAAEHEARNMRVSYPEDNQHAHEYPCPVNKNAWHVSTRRR